MVHEYVIVKITVHFLNRISGDDIKESLLAKTPAIIGGRGGERITRWNLLSRAHQEKKTQKEDRRLDILSEDYFI